MNYNVFLSSANTGSKVTVTGEKGGGVISNDGVVSEPNTNQVSNDVQSNTNAETQVPADGTEVADAQAGGIFGNWSVFILLYGGLALVYYFFIFKPQKKRQTEAKELISSLAVGDEVMTSSGYYGKITDVGEEVCVIEFGTNKGVRIPVNKREIVKKEIPKY